MRTRNVVSLLVTILAFVTPAIASDGTGLNWVFQYTGCQTTGYNGSFQTAVALRDDRMWPVIFAGGVQQEPVHAYAMLPTGWRPLSSNPLLPAPATPNYRLSAATSPGPDGRVAAVLADSTGQYGGMAVVGGSRIGWSTSEANAVTFDGDGNLYASTDSRVVSVGACASGAVGEVSLDQPDGPNSLAYSQYDPWLGNWAAGSLLFSGTPVAKTIQMAMDTLGRPYVGAIVGAGGGPYSLVVQDFDNLGWHSATLGTEELTGSVTMAADAQGGVGLVWQTRVDGSPTTSLIKYSYNDGNAGTGWSTTTVTTVVSPFPQYQSMGLAFDRNDFPVISFAVGNDIWLAYDPPSSVPEPGSWMLLVTAGMGMLLVWRGNRRRFGVGMRTVCLACFAVALLGAVGSATASDGTALYWAFQRTGFQTTVLPQTAVAFRDGRTWPVVFAGGFAEPLNAYGLFPVSSNPMEPAYWHQVGSDLLPEVQGGPILYLSAATSPGPDGRVAAVLTDPIQIPTGFAGAAVVGGSQIGWTTMYGVNGVAFDGEGNLYTATESTVVPPVGTAPLVGIGGSTTGDKGAVDSGDGQPYVTYAHYHPWVAEWDSVFLDFGASHVPSTISMAMDTLGRPHVCGLSEDGSGQLNVVVHDFDNINLRWQKQILSTVPNNTLANVAIAADGQGGVGMAWVEEDIATGDGMIKYAYNDGSPNTGWTVSPVASSVTDLFNSHYAATVPDPSSLPQSIGLAFDRNEFPAISFVANGQTSGEIWLAYDPPFAVPEPGAWVLLGGLALVLARLRWRPRRS